MFITYNDLGKILSKQQCTSSDFTVDGNHIELDDSYWHDDALFNSRVDLTSKTLVELPPKPAEGYDFDYVTLEWKPNIDQLKANAMATRLALLQQSDWTDTASAVTRLPNYQQWQDYRQALRDVTQQSGYPLNIIWPEQPQ